MSPQSKKRKKNIFVGRQLTLGKLLSGSEIFYNPKERNWVFATNLKFLIPISFKPDDVNIFNLNLNYLVLQNSYIEISKVYDILLQRYRD